MHAHTRWLYALKRHSPLIYGAGLLDRNSEFVFAQARRNIGVRLGEDVRIDA